MFNNKVLLIYSTFDISYDYKCQVMIMKMETLLYNNPISVTGDLVERILTDALEKTLLKNEDYIASISNSTLKGNRHSIRLRGKQAIKDLITITEHVGKRDILKIFDPRDLSKLIYNVLLKLDTEKQDMVYAFKITHAMERAINVQGKHGDFKGDVCKIEMKYGFDEKTRKEFENELFIDNL